MTKVLIEFDEALERLDQDKEFLITLLNELLIQIDESWDGLLTSVAESDYAKLRYISHSIKGAASSLGVVGMAEIFSQLEDMAAMNSASDAPELLRVVESQKAELIEFLHNV
ncbi:MAG: Hpt domain-containing protein [Calditrichaceae bacterium]